MTAVVNGIETYFVARGRGNPVLCVHGFPLSGRLWSQLADGLQDDYRVIVPDLRGLGRSQSTESTSMAQFADDLNALLDHVGEDRPVVLVGLSMGGYVAFEFFRRHRSVLQPFLQQLRGPFHLARSATPSGFLPPDDHLVHLVLIQPEHLVLTFPLDPVQAVG